VGDTVKTDPEESADETGKVMPEREIRTCPACGTKFAGVVAGNVCPVCLLRAAVSGKVPDTASTPEYRLEERGPTGVSRRFENYELLLD
jgi:hypothetical protein